MKCDKCKRKDWCDSHSMEYDSCIMGGFSDYLPLTNADRIRAMTDEELAEWIADIADHGGGRCAPGCYDCSNNRCEDAWLDWMKQEATE